MSTKLPSITRRARENPKEQFIALAHMLTVDFLQRCFWELKRDKSPGIDGVTVKEYGANLEENLQDLKERLRTKRYRPKPVRRVYIPKSDGTKRPLGMPAVEDKIVEMGVKKILEAIFEVDFVDVSYGFRPNRDCHKALDELDRAIMTKPVNYVLDADIEKFFDTVDHGWLMKCLKQRVKDRSLLNLVERFLRAGIMEEGKYIETDKGTPQGGVLSPLLANIYLHYILDLWFEKKFKRQMKGYAQLIRYADDFILCFQAKKEAEELCRMLKQRLSKFGLKLSEDKTRIVEFGRYIWQKAQREGKKVATFDFVGFTLYCTKSKQGRFWLGRKTARVKYIQKLKAMNQWLKDVRNLVKMKVWWKQLRPKLNGHFRYYGVAGNQEAMGKFRSETMKLVYKWVNRRSQKKSYNWEQFLRYEQYNPLPQPKVYHPFPVRQWGKCY